MIEVRTAKIMIYTRDMAIAVQRLLIADGHVWDDGSTDVNASAWPFIYIHDGQMMWDIDPAVYQHADMTALRPIFNADKSGLQAVKLVVDVPAEVCVSLPELPTPDKENGSPDNFAFFA